MSAGGGVWLLIVLITEIADLCTYHETSQTADYPQMMPSIESDKHLQERGGEGCPDRNFTRCAKLEYSFVIVLPPSLPKYLLA
jgi:hypothetical protein